MSNEAVAQLLADPTLSLSPLSDRLSISIQYIHGPMANSLSCILCRWLLDATCHAVQCAAWAAFCGVQKPVALTPSDTPTTVVILCRFEIHPRTISHPLTSLFPSTPFPFHIQVPSTQVRSVDSTPVPSASEVAKRMEHLEENAKRLGVLFTDFSNWIL